MTSNRTLPMELAGWPFASLVPTVNDPDDCACGLHDGKASGGPCVRLGAVHELYAGTSDARIGVAPLGRGYPPVPGDTFVCSVSALLPGVSSAWLPSTLA